MREQFPDLGIDVPEIAPAELKRRLDDGEGLTLLDTRPAADVEAWQIIHPTLTTVNVPFSAFVGSDGAPVQTVPDRVPAAEPLVVSCAKGISSRYVAEFLAGKGRDVLVLERGMEGWAGLNEARELTPNVVQFHRPSSGCLAYLLVDGDEAAVVDPLRTFAEEYETAARDRGARLRYAIDTHVHADHVSGVREVAAATDAEPIYPIGAADRGLAFKATLVADGDRLPLGERTIEALGLPGHTTEMTGYRFDDVLLTGDSVFLDAVARPDLEDPSRAEAAADRLWETIQRLTDLGENPIVAPGHAGPTTEPTEDGTYGLRLETLRAQLEAFAEPRAAFVERITTGLPPRPQNDERIIAVNLGRASVDPEEAFELELGPNNCAVEA
ncbi:MBL fold metallo-hydrolase [Halobacteriales archaeon QH_10_67_13]|nr:MAG: MBL fold metallo-hydrolase [Halobacteriales archaeon QH_10_67_13]